MYKYFFAIFIILFLYTGLFSYQSVNAAYCSSPNWCSASGGSCTCADTSATTYWCTPSCPAGTSTCTAPQGCNTFIAACNRCGNHATCYTPKPTSTPTPTATPKPTSTPIPTPTLTCSPGAKKGSYCQTFQGSGYCHTIEVSYSNTCTDVFKDTGTNCCAVPTTPPAPKIPQSCGQSCNCNSDCGTGWCNGGWCGQTDKQYGSCDGAACRPPPPPPPPVATPTPQDTPTPTPAQLTGAISQPPTPTLNPNVNRTTSSGKKLIQRWVCLQSAPCSQSSSGCSGKGALNHRAKLTVNEDYKPLPSAETYLFECIQTGKSICTTGISSLDKQILGVDNKAALAPYGYTFNNGLYKSNGQTTELNPVKSDAQANINPVEWESYTTNNLNRIFMAMNETQSLSLNGNDGGQQQGVLSMDSGGKKCITIKWDPYGRVFDSYTLEPVKNAKVTLLQKDESGKFLPINSDDVLGGLVNPLTTPNDGSFAFSVPDGVYKLEVSAPNYRFTNNKNTLNKQYTEIYSDLYNGEEIVQKQGIIHVDIALEPIDKNQSTKYALYNAVTLLSNNQTIDNKLNTEIIEGRVSHPLSTIRVYGKKLSGNEYQKTTQLGSVKSDKMGQFKIEIPLGHLQKGESVGYLEIEKNKFNQQPDNNTIFNTIYNFFLNVKNTFVKEDRVSISIDPVLPYLDGYALDTNGKRLQSTTVGLFIDFSNKPVIEVPTDKNGHFVIGQADIPPFQYNIKYYQGDNIIRSLSTSDFMRDNE